MKINYRLAAMASAITIMATGVIGAFAAAPASATVKTTWCLKNSTICLYSEGYDNQVRTSSNGTDFIRTYPTSFEGQPAYQWRQAGTSNCLEFDAQGGDIVRMDTCVSGRASQIWRTTADGSMVNDYATGLYGQQACMSDPNGFIYVYDCTTAPNHFWQEG